MPALPEFDGFPRATLKFFADLKANNDRDWFKDNKSVYLKEVVEPGKAFILAIGGLLEGLHPGINYDTRTNGAGSMFRIYRDVRFSKDKSPYKTHLGMVFWLGPGKKTNSPGFYVGLSSDGAGAHAGMWRFPKETLASYRHAMGDPSKADRLQEIVDRLDSQGYEIGGQTYKRVPRGFDKDHPHAGLLKHSSVHAGMPEISRDIVTSPDFVPTVFEHFANLSPLVEWIDHNLTN
jgi:uncharacterized protein (TIGR02453 family)